MNRRIFGAYFAVASFAPVSRSGGKTGGRWSVQPTSRRPLSALTGDPSKFKPTPRQYTNMATLETLHFDNLVLRSLPIDKEKENFVRQVGMDNVRM